VSERHDKGLDEEKFYDRDRPQLFEELRFAKTQQWYIATAAVTLLGAIFALRHAVSNTATSPLDCKEKVGFAVAITLVVTFACTFLIMLQKYMRDTRLRLDPKDIDAAVRGVSILGVLVGIIIMSGAAVLYFIVFR
jgi:hypothetical protein